MAVATVLFLIQSMEIKVSYFDRVWKSIMLTMVQITSRFWRMNGTSQLRAFSGPVVKETGSETGRLSQFPSSGTESVKVEGSIGRRNAGADRIAGKLHSRLRNGRGNIPTMAEIVVPPQTKSGTPRVIRL